MDAHKGSAIVDLVWEGSVRGGEKLRFGVSVAAAAGGLHLLHSRLGINDT